MLDGRRLQSDKLPERGRPQVLDIPGRIILPIGNIEPAGLIDVHRLFSDPVEPEPCRDRLRAIPVDFYRFARFHSVVLLPLRGKSSVFVLVTPDAPAHPQDAVVIKFRLHFEFFSCRKD